MRPRALRLPVGHALLTALECPTLTTLTDSELHKLTCVIGTHQCFNVMRGVHPNSGNDFRRRIRTVRRSPKIRRAVLRSCDHVKQIRHTVLRSCPPDALWSAVRRFPATRCPGRWEAPLREEHHYKTTYTSDPKVLIYCVNDYK